MVLVGDEHTAYACALILPIDEGRNAIGIERIGYGLFPDTDCGALLERLLLDCIRLVV